MSEEIKEILWDCEKQLNEASGYNDTTNKILDYIERLESQLQQKENIIKEAIEYINNHQLVFEVSSKKQIAYWFDMFYKELIEILDKGE